MIENSGAIPSRRYATEDKKRLTARLCDTYSRMMSVDIRRISIAIRETGEAALMCWVCNQGGPSALYKCRFNHLGYAAIIP